MGLDVSFRAGLLPRRATLADLSTRGARLVSRWPIEPGKKLSITIHERAGIPESISLKGRVIRMGLDERLGDTPYSAAIAFESVPDRVRQEIEWILEERARGPATLHAERAGHDPEQPGGEALASPETRSEDLRCHIDVEVDVRLEGPLEPEADLNNPDAANADLERSDAAAAGEQAKLSGSAGPTEPVEHPESNGPTEPVEHSAPIGPTEPVEHSGPTAPVARQESTVSLWPSDPLGSSQPPESNQSLESSQPPDPGEHEADAPGPEPGDRRSENRGAYNRRVPAFGDRAMRVLVARDLSMNGMRIEREKGLEPGDRLHLAVYGDASEEPFLVWATVDRVDGSNGMYLAFDDLHEVVAEQLDAVVAGLPAVESLHDDEARAMGTVVTEILNG